MTLTGDELRALQNRHRVEEACEPYGLLPTFPEGRKCVLPRAALEPSTGLESVLLANLAARGVEATQGAAGIGLSIPVDAEAARELSRCLGEALYDARHVHPQRFLARRTPGSHVPHSEGALGLPASRGLMERVVRGNFMPDDKKPPVLDLYRSTGPYLASVDQDPLILFDAASQISSHAGGLNPPKVLEALYTGRFGDFPIREDRESEAAEAALSALRSLLLDGAGGGLDHVTFCNSGAEANEVALRLAARRRPGRKTVIAFEGAFHGRTMWALHATWNPNKRLRFELDDFKAQWVPWPSWNGLDPVEKDTDASLRAWLQPLGARKRACSSAAGPLERREFASLQLVEQALESDHVVAIMVEPMQSEGGDRWATGRFFCRLRALALAYDVPFIVDEVQTGFHLGGPFFWHRRWDLPAAPDVITSAKKCQVGAVISRWAIEEPPETSLTSAVRGACQAAMVSEDEARAYEASVRPRLAELAKEYPDLVLDPRACGYAFAFDLPNPPAMQHFIQERLWRGYMVYGAGDRTLRFRLSGAMTPQALDALFERLRSSLGTLAAGQSTEWRQVELPDQAKPWPPSVPRLPDGYRIVSVPASRYGLVRDALVAIENVTYERARQDDMDQFGELLKEDGSQCILALWGNGDLGEAEVAGLAFAFPLEHFAHVEGPDTDPTLGREQTIYSADICLHPNHRGKGLGPLLKRAQVQQAMSETAPDGGQRFAYMTGRNRVGSTNAMQAINARFGAWPVRRLSNQYRGEGEAEYYRIALCAPRLPALPEGPGSPGKRLDLRRGLEHRIILRAGSDDPSSEIRECLQAGHMNGAIANKLSLCNFVTPGVSRAMEILRGVAPEGLGHLVVANGRSEMFDKGLRAFKFHRPKGRWVISFGPVYAGHTSAAARSISLEEGHPENVFGWSNVVDPTVDPGAALADVSRRLSASDPDSVLAVVAEPLFWRTGRLTPRQILHELRGLCTEHGVPLAIVENTTGLYRNGLATWISDAWDVKPDAVFYYPGGQLGLTFLSDGAYVPDKLTLISTWDGDEVSFTRLLWELRIASELDLGDATARLEDAIRPLGKLDGLGLFQTVTVADAGRIREVLREEGFDVGLTDEGSLRFVPGLNVSREELTHLKETIHGII